jgi:hypothetical protein
MRKIFDGHFIDLVGGWNDSSHIMLKIQQIHRAVGARTVR